MTAIAPAPAPTHAQPVLHSAHSAHVAFSQTHDPLAFAAVLDSAPGGDAKAKPSSEKRAQTPIELSPHGRPQTQIPNPSFFNAALAASLPVATPSTIANGEPAGDTNPPALAPKAVAQTPARDAASAPRVASAAEAGDALGAKLIRERSFHANISAFNPVTAPPIGGSSSAVEPPAIAILDAAEAAVPSPPAAMPRPSQATAPSPTASPSTSPERNASRADRTPPAGSGPAPFSAGRARGERQTEPAATIARVAAPAAGRPASRPEASPSPDGSEFGWVRAVCRRTADPMRLNPRLRRR